MPTSACVLAGRKNSAPRLKSRTSIRSALSQALEYEIERQIGVIEGGGKITQETRLYNSHEGKTYGMRSKEQAHDYRYFPEPDLLPLVVDEKWRGGNSQHSCRNFRKRAASA